MKLTVCRISYNGSFEPMNGWYVSPEENNDCAEFLHIAFTEQGVWFRKFIDSEIDVSNILINKFNAMFKYGVFYYQNKHQAELAAEWIESMIVLHKLL